MQRQSVLNYFRISSREGMEQFALPLSILCKQLKHSFRTYVDSESQNPVILVTLDAEPGSGKSTLSQSLLWRISDDYEDSDGLVVNFVNDGSSSLAWQSYWNHSHGFENRVYDSLLEGPFRTAFDVLGDDPPAGPPKRTAPGFDLIEHSYKVPRSYIAMKIDIQKLSNGDRVVCVALPDVNEAQKQEFEEFSEYVNRLDL